MSWNIITSEIIEWLIEYEGQRFHAILSDPPYALISIAKRFGQPGSVPAQEGNDGRFSRLSSGFMSSEWDSFHDYNHYESWIAKWSELLIEKTLYPGAVCMFFGGTRTFHHLGVGLERGGFEVVDCLMWLHSQGFPKSTSVSRFLEEDDAETWTGFSSHLKPAWEPIYLCRAPRGKHTFAQLAVEFGSGALHIDGSRISGPPPHHDEAGRPSGKTALPGKSEATHAHSSGRWPANLLLTHHEDCMQVGEVEVEGRTLNRYPSHGAGGSFAFYAEDHKGEDYESEEMPPEVVGRWACVPGCAIRMLDDQAGDTKSRSGGVAGRQDRYVGGEYTPIPRTGYDDRGGPSRFFYSAKASRSEKDRGLEDFYWQRVDKGFERISLEQYEQLDKKQRARGCIHPTVKPHKLLTYLATLTLPPELEDRPRRILVPFAGSGSEMIAALRAGWDEVVGVEMVSNYVEIAEARLNGGLGMR